jgi:hypothetical protein
MASSLNPQGQVFTFCVFGGVVVGVFGGASVVVNVVFVAGNDTGLSPPFLL